MAQVAKFPGAAAALADFYGELPNFPELVLSGAHNNSTTSIVVTTAIPAGWPQAGWITIDSELMRVTSWAVSTFTVAARDGSAGNSQTTTAASHADLAKVGMYLTALTVNQILAEIIALETNALGGIHNPNLVLNSDFARRTVWGTMMPERFTDLSGTTKIDGGAAGSVAANIFTQGAANNEYAWCAGSFVWRDGRASATFKATATAGIYTMRWRIDASNYIAVSQNTGSLYIQKFIAAVNTNVTSVAQALTLNRWYWLEIEKQGTTIVAKLYDTGGTASGVSKASSTLLQTLTGTVADASVQVGAHISITSDQAAAQWGGIATGDGGVYVEGWLPESWAVAFGGTIGGQALGFDESADAGPLSRQWALRAYIPAASRQVSLQGYVDSTAASVGRGSIAPSTAYTTSGYMKVSGKGGSGDLIAFQTYARKMDLTLSGATTDVRDAAEAVWTRKPATMTTDALTRTASVLLAVNPSSTATGTAYFQLAQLEQGSAATAWRNAPADDGTAALHIGPTLAPTAITSASAVAVDPRDLGVNFLMPWDGRITVTVNMFCSNGGLNQNLASVFVDGAVATPGPTWQMATEQQVASKYVSYTWTISMPLAAGKHRIDLRAASTAGTLTFSSGPAPYMEISASRGK